MVTKFQDNYSIFLECLEDFFIVLRKL